MTEKATKPKVEVEEDKNESTSETTTSEKKQIDTEFHEFMADLKKLTKEDNKFTQDYQL